MSTHVVYKHVVYKHVPGSVPVNRGNWPPPEEACTKKLVLFSENWYMVNSRHVPKKHVLLGKIGTCFSGI